MPTMMQLLQDDVPAEQRGLASASIASAAQQQTGVQPAHANGSAPAVVGDRPDTPMSDHRAIDKAPPSTLTGDGEAACAPACTAAATPPSGTLAVVAPDAVAVGACGQDAQLADIVDTPPPYQNMSYSCDTGVWFQGFWFANFDHLMAYRRTAIAYNYHFFGIRPEFRPPANLPRPRPPPTPCAAHTPAPLPPSATVGSGAATSAPVPGCAAQPMPSPAAHGLDSALNAEPMAAASGAAAVRMGITGGLLTRLPGQLPEQGDSPSPCCSPGGSSECSNVDSDDGLGSDGCRREVAEEARELLRLHTAAAAAAVGRDLAAAAACGGGPSRAADAYARNAPAAAGGYAPMAAALAALGHDVVQSPSKRVAREGGGFSWVGCVPVSWPVSTAVGGTSAVPTQAAAAAGGVAVDHQFMVGVPLPTLRCRVARPGGGAGAAAGGAGVVFGGAPAEPLSPVRGAGLSSPGSTAAVCPAWLEPQMGDLLGRVVGEALWGSDDGY